MAKVSFVEEGRRFDQLLTLGQRVAEEDEMELLESESEREVMPDNFFTFIPKKKRGSVGERYLSFKPHCLHSICRINYCQKLQQIDTKKTTMKRVSFGKPQNNSRQVKKVKKLRKAAKIDEDLGPPPPMPSELRERIERKGGEEIKLVIMKRLFASDLAEQQDRLSMPKNQVKKYLGSPKSFLREEEKNEMKEKRGVEVKLMEPCGHESDMKLRKWHMNSKSFVLNSSWRRVLEREGNRALDIFQVGTAIQVWCFRIEGQLWFAINKVADEDVNVNAAASGSSSHGREASSSHSSSMAVQPQQCLFSSVL